MAPATRMWFEVLARTLFWAAGAVLALSMIGAVAVATGDNALPFFETVEAQSRAGLTIASVIAGITGAGILSALGAILTILLAGTEAGTEAEAGAAAASALEPSGES